MMSSSPPADLLRADERSTTVIRRGPWTVDLRAGQLESIRHSGRHVLRSIRAVVRDQDWRTLPSTVVQLSGIDHDPGSSQPILVDGSAGDDEASLLWRLSITADDDSLTVSLRAVAQTDFLRNRLGLIVLHSPQNAGEALTVRHPSAETTQTTFPVMISPHQPAVDIRGLDWSATDEHGTTACSLDFEGDVFEMEDQRNWTDASFKTYSTPLSIPFPAEVHAGDVIEQAVVLRCSGDGVEPPHPADVEEVELVVGGRIPGVFMPRLSTIASTAGDAEGPAQQAAWAQELLVELDPASTGWRIALDRAVRDAGARCLDVRIVAAGVDEAAPLLDALAEHPSSTFTRIGLFARQDHLADPETARSLVAALDRRGLDIQVIAGTRAHFTELNRGIDRLEGWRGPITFSITPFMHDTSGHQLVESLGMQREVGESAWRLAAGRPLHIGPITLGARFNAVATTPAPVPASDALDEGYGAALVRGATDPRSAASSLAAWLLSSVAALAAPRVLSLCYLEEWGARSAAHPDSLEMLGWLSQLEGAALREAHVEGLAVIAASQPRAGGREVILIGNTQSEPRTVRLPGSAAPAVIPGGAVRRFERLPWRGAEGDRISQE